MITSDPAPGPPSRGDLVEDSPTVTRLIGVKKAFGGVQALRGVDLTVSKGSIHALVGENGAGKSTLGKIISGVIQPDEGDTLVNGDLVKLRSPRDALNVGIATIEQEVALVSRLSVRDNILLGNEPRRFGFVRRRELKRRCDALLADSGFGLDPSALAGKLSLGAQQQVEIVRALSRDAELVVMDEPTAALNEEETQTLHRAIRALAATGTSVLLVSHFLREVLSLADTVTVLRDGKVVRTGPAADETEDSLILAMLGRSLGSVFPSRQPPTSDAPAVLSARDLFAPGVRGVTIDVAPGEIVGLAGLGGSGRTELARALYGAAPIHNGEVRIGGDMVKTPGPRVSIDHGLRIIPESRKDEGLLLGRSITENITISTLPQISAHGLIRKGIERQRTAQIMAKLAIPGDRGSGKVSTLSGGNQQKVLFARLLMDKPVVIIADEPTRGVDIGAKAAIYQLLVSLAAEGIGILVISSEIEEIIGLAHRVVVLHQGRVSAELRGNAINEGSILAAAFNRPQAMKEVTP
jgi:ABC-type sugar transport system ATPase subunit